MDSFFVYLRNPKRLAIGILKKLSFIFSDSLYLKLRYYFEIGEVLDLKNPKTFNEKINWLKIHHRKPEYSMMVDKLEVKNFVKEKIGEEFIIPTIGVWDFPEEIDFESLPQQFVLKTTHDGGSFGVIICKDKSTFNFNSALLKLKRSMLHSPYDEFREWPYKNVSRRIIAEKFMEDDKYEDLLDYKFFCFNGEPRLCQVISDRKSEEKIDFYDMDWVKVNNLVGLNPRVCNSRYNHEKPVSFDKMKEFAKILSSGIPFVRIDLYEINGKCYFGEITFFPASGFGFFRPKFWNEIIGSWIQL